MAEKKYKSKITSSRSPLHSIYAGLGNLHNLEQVKDLIPQDKVTDIEITPEQIRFKVDGLAQKVTISIVDCKEDNMLKYSIDAAIVKADFWIQMKEVAVGDVRLKLTLGCDIPLMFRMMVENKLKDGLDQAAEMLAQMPFENWTDK